MSHSHLNSSVADNSRADQLAAIIDEYSLRAGSGEEVDIETYARRLPGNEDIVREVLHSLKLVHCWSELGSSAATVLPNRIGEFEILEEIGRGGMGVVYRARQSSLDRIVALKILPLAASLDRKCLERFRIETHSASILQHPNIVAIYGTGCEQGVHYYAMQYIAGRSLQEFIQTQESMDVRGAVEITVAIAQALQHAHELGVIHRDVKPSNLLLDENGKIWITDFGLAQIDDQGTLTLSGDFVGTLRYMSPEQTIGGSTLIDQRTDIYALGATLYELLTRQPMVPGNGRMEILRNVIEVEARFTRSGCRIPRDLQTILLKATAKDRDFRYPTAADMADDLQRFLDQRPIFASRPGLTQRFVKFALRNPSTSISLALLPLLFLIGMTFYNFTISAQKREIESALQIARDNETKARLEASRAQTVSDVLLQLVASANPDQTKGSGYTVRQLLDDLSENVFRQLADQPDVAVTLRTTIGNAYRRLGSPDRALHHLHWALNYHERNNGKPPQLAQDLVDLAWNYAALGKYDQAVVYAQRAAEIHQHSKSREAVQALWCLQHALIYDLQFAAADTVAAEAMELAQSIDTTPPELANIVHDMAQSKTRQGKPAESLPLAQRAIELHVLLHGSTHPESGWGYEALGRALMASEKSQPAVEAFKKALAIFETNYPPQHKSVRMTLEQLELALKSIDAPSELATVQRQRVRNILGNVFVKSETSETSLLEFLVQHQNYLAAGELVMVFPDAFETTHDTLIAIEILQQYKQDLATRFATQLPTEKLNQWRKVSQQLLERSAQLCPTDPMLLNSVAWLSVISDDAQARLPSQAIELAERASQLDALNGAYWNTLGLAYLRAGRYADAVLALKRSQTFETTDEYDTILLSIAHSHLKHRQQAQADFESAKAQYEARKSKSLELEQFFEEAASLLAAAVDSASS